MRAETTNRRPAFSLVEVLISVMILGIGMVMIAAAFPVGLRYYELSTDETTAALLARSTLSRLQARRTFAYCGMEIGLNYEPDARDADGPRAEPWAQVAINECFEEDADGVGYLFDTGGGRHTAAAGRPGALLEAQGLDDDTDHGNHSSNIHDWMPTAERLSGMDGRFACHVFYRRTSAPLGDRPHEPVSYVVYVAVQKTPLREYETAAWSARFPPPSAETTVEAVTGESHQVTWANGGFTVEDGAMLVDVDTGDWYAVVDAETGTLTLNRPAASVAGHKVRVLNHCVSVYRGIMSKELIR